MAAPVPKLVLQGLPNPRQREFFETTARHTCYGGARGGGKSWAMRRKMVLLMLNYDGLRGLILRRTLPELKENIINPLRIELNGFADYNETEKVFRFPNGSRLKFGYCDSESDVYQYQGQEYEVIALEEATHFTEDQMRFLTTCNRTTRTDFSPRMFYTCNPGGVGHDWVKRLFIDREYRKGEKPENYAFIPARVYDNHALMIADPEYVENLEALPEDMRRAHLDGDWDVIEGQYFKEWRRERHVCEPFTIPAHWRRFRAMDWGYNDPCCVLWFAVSPDKRIYVYDEYYRSQRNVNQVAASIKEITGATKITYTVGSPDMWQKRGMQNVTHKGIMGESIAESLGISGVPVQAADNARIVGWQRVREYLADAPDGKPWLQVFPNCVNLIKYMPQMQYDEHNKEDAADGNDHAPEALRYGLMSRPSPVVTLKQQTRKVYDLRDPFTEPPRSRASGFLSL